MASAPSAVRASCSEEEYRGFAYTVAAAAAEEWYSGHRLVSAEAIAAGSQSVQSYFGWRSDVRRRIAPARLRDLEVVKTSGSDTTESIDFTPFAQSLDPSLRTKMLQTARPSERPMSCTMC